MALVLKDRVRETSTTIGTGTITLAGAVSGFQSFSNIGNANTTYYTIAGGTEWEVGLGTYTSSGNTLSRDTVLSSSNGNSLVNFSAGTKDVFVTYPAEKSIYQNASSVANITSLDVTTALGYTPGTTTSGTSILYGNGSGGFSNVTIGSNLTFAGGTLSATGGGGMTYPGVGIALSTGSAWDTSITDNSANWNTAYTDRLKWDGGATGLTASTGRTSLGLGTAATMTGPSGTIVGTTDTQTLSAKTLTTPIISSISNTGTLTLPTSTDTLVGRATTDTLTNKTITGTKETVFTITDGAAFEIDPANGGIQTITLGASRTPKGTNFTAGQSVTLMINDGTAYTITWTDATFGTGGVIWVGGTAPTLATTGFTVIELWEVGTQVYGALVGNVA